MLTQNAEPMPAWLRENWPRLLRLVRITIEQQPPELRTLLVEAIEHGDIGHLEYAVDDERRLVHFGFHGTAIGSATFECVTGVKGTELRH